MIIRNILAFSAAAALLTLTGCADAPEGQVANPIDNIMTRTSVRAYTAEKLTAEQVETLLRAAMAAPSAVNKQPWDFVVVDEPALLDSLQAALPNVPLTRANCQQVIVVCGNMQKALEGDAQAYWIQDCSAAT
ncbi:MAG: nitroreductase family protein, partial [Bacteroidales bacterium]|nr:nitroreductase family protein [Bacteroidales bacterium]